LAEEEDPPERVPPLPKAFAVEFEAATARARAAAEYEFMSGIVTSVWLLSFDAGDDVKYSYGEQRGSCCTILPPGSSLHANQASPFYYD